MLRYKYVVAAEVLAIFSDARAREREDLLLFFERLTEDPFARSQSTFQDGRSRECQVRRAGRWMVVYFVSHADAQIQIIGLERLKG